MPAAPGLTLGSAVQSFPQLPQFRGSAGEPQTVSCPPLSCEPASGGGVTGEISRPWRQPAADSNTSARQ